MFQFPSNGKVYSKVKSYTALGEHNWDCFNSLQTGKCIQRKHCARSVPAKERFNSLQTGKCIQRIDVNVNVTQKLVSIPFKRESVFKDNTWIPQGSDTTVSIPFKRESVFKGACSMLSVYRYFWFQFPSNGKVYSKIPTAITTITITIVSIPFKRESVFKGRLP